MRSPWDWGRERLLRLINTLRFPYLLALTATLFVIDLVLPDVIPWADEILLGLATLLLARIRRQPPPGTMAERHDGAA